MSKKIHIVSMALLALSMTVPAKADIIADQSRISVAAPHLPWIDTAETPWRQGMRPNT